jgi:hypothetical protein
VTAAEDFHDACARDEPTPAKTFSHDRGWAAAESFSHDRGSAAAESFSHHYIVRAASEPFANRRLVSVVPDDHAVVVAICIGSRCNGTDCKYESGCCRSKHVLDVHLCLSISLHPKLGNAGRWTWSHSIREDKSYAAFAERAFNAVFIARSSQEN